MSTVSDDVSTDARRARFDDSCAKIVDRFQAFRESHTQYAEFSLTLFDRLDVIGRDLAERQSAIDTDRNAANQRAEEAEQASAEISAVQSQLSKQDAELIKLRSELEVERERSAKEKASLDEETREFLDDLVQERDSLSTRLQEAQIKASEQTSGFESELELLRTQLGEANRQIVKLRGPSVSVGDVVLGAVSEESLVASEPHAEPPAARIVETTSTVDHPSPDTTIPPKATGLESELPENRKKDLRNSAGVELESLMSQVRMLQQDVARRRNQRSGK